MSERRGNNIGKSTVCEALDLLRGPERLLRRPAVDEHDFFAGQYLDEDGQPVSITLRAVLTVTRSRARVAKDLRAEVR
jgi:putative ATP-dependent endonuclease of the OLD family